VKTRADLAVYLKEVEVRVAPKRAAYRASVVRAVAVKPERIAASPKALVTP
jgi:hypothetical protein